MNRISQIIENTIGKEGRYSNNAKDSGGETMWGITKSVARSNGYAGKMIDLPRERAVEIYTNEYFAKPGFDRVMQRSLSLAEEMFDTGVNIGVGHPPLFLQRSLNLLNREGKLWLEVTVDGKIGERTLAALDRLLAVRKAQGELVLVRMMNVLQGARYIEISERYPKNEEFVYGWFLNRVVV